MGSVALAGPNAGGTIFVSDANEVFTTDIVSYCGVGTAPVSCAEADTVINGATDLLPRVLKVYAAFLPGSSPRLKGMTFGIYYDANTIAIVGGGFGPCIGDLNNGATEFQGPGWPGSGTGDALVWQFTQTTELVECYWLAAYNYAGPGCFRLGPNPDPGLAGMFSDDAVPPQLDAILGYGALGFDEACTGTPPRCPIPVPPQTGACCINNVCVDNLTQSNCEGQGGHYYGDGSTCPQPDCPPPVLTGACCIDNTCFDNMTQADCERQGGHYYGDGSTCPQPDCQPVPVEESTWGSIKANYR